MLKLSNQVFGTAYGTAVFFLKPLMAASAKIKFKRWALQNLRSSAESRHSESAIKAVWESETDHHLRDCECLDALEDCGLVRDGQVFAEFIQN